MTSSTSAPRTDDASSYRLPATVLPHAYRLTLTPDLGAAAFTGEVAIDVTVVAPTATVVLNAAELEIATATVVVGATTVTSMATSPVKAAAPRSGVRVSR
jgi:aminopeptidase N